MLFRRQSISPQPKLQYETHPKDCSFKNSERTGHQSKRSLNNDNKKIRVRSASAGRNREDDLRARYWAFLFDNLQRAVDEIYQNCERDESVEESKEAIMILENYSREFKALAEWLNLNKTFETTSPPNRPNSLAWEVRKSMPRQMVFFHTFFKRMNGGLPPTIEKSSISSAEGEDKSVSSTPEDSKQEQSKKQNSVSTSDPDVCDSKVSEKVEDLMQQDTNNDSVKAEQGSDKKLVEQPISIDQSNTNSHVMKEENKQDSPSNKTINFVKPPLVKNSKILSTPKQLITKIANSSSVNTKPVTKPRTSVATTANISDVRQINSRERFEKSNSKVSSSIPNRLSRTMPTKALPQTVRSGPTLVRSTSNILSVRSVGSKENITRPITRTVTLSVTARQKTVPKKIKDADGWETVRGRNRHKNSNATLIDNSKRGGMQTASSQTVVDWSQISMCATWPGPGHSDTRTPGRALQVHEKLSSPSRKRSLSETIRRHEEKFVKAQEAREKYLVKKAEKFKEIAKKAEEMKAWKEEQQLQLKISMETKLQKANEKRLEQLKKKVEKAHDEESKVFDILEKILHSSERFSILADFYFYFLG